MKNLNARFRSRRKKGVSTVEFALVFPIFIMMVFALIDFCFYYYYESTLTHITRVTLRSAVTGKKVLDPSNPTNTNYLTRKQGVLKAAKDASVLPLIKFRSDTFSSTNSYDTDLITFVSTADDGTVKTNDNDLGGSGARIKMTYEQDYKFLTPFVRWLNTNNVTSNRIKISTSFKAEDFDIK